MTERNESGAGHLCRSLYGLSFLSVHFGKPLTESFPEVVVQNLYPSQGEKKTLFTMLHKNQKRQQP